MPQRPPPLEIVEDLKKQSGKPYIHKISQREIDQFIRHAEQARKGNKTPVSFVDFIKNTILENEHPNVIPDFSQMPIITPKTLAADSMLDLSDVDFTGCSINDSTFRHCNLSRSIFCDLNLKNVTFEQCAMQETDLRGAALSSCNITTQEENELEESAALENYRGLKLGASFNTMQNHLGSSILQEREELTRLENDLKDTSKVIRETEEFIEEDKKAHSQGVLQRAFNYVTNNMPEGTKEHQDEVKKLEDQLAEQKLHEGSLKKQLESKQLDYETKALQPLSKLPFHPSIIKIATTPAPTQASTQSFEDFENELLIPEIGDDDKIEISSRVPGLPTLVTLDPTYIKGSAKVERDQKKEYFPSTKEDLEVYKEKKQKQPNLSFNEFIRGFASAQRIPKDTQIVANFSGQDLSGFDFNDLDLRGACFAGATLNDAKFNGTNLSGANLEGANLTGAEFKNTTARDVNMRSATLNGVKIEASDFVRADMSHSTSSKIEIEDVNLNFSTINNSNWENAVIADSSVNYADFEESTLQGKVQSSSMQHSNFNSATIQSCKIINSDLSLSTMIGTEAQGSKFLEGSVLNGIDAREAHLEHSTIDSSCNAKKLNLNGAFIDDMTAREVDFTGSTLQKVQAKRADLEGATLTNVPMQLSDLEGANLDHTKASGLDLTASYVAGMHANDATLKRATLAGISVYKEIYDYHKELQKLPAEASPPPTPSITIDSHIKEADGKLELSRTDLTQADLTSATIPKTNLDRSHLVGATLKGTKLRSSTLKRANINNATTETSTDLHDCTAEGVSGKLQHTDENKSTERIPIEEKIDKDKENPESNQELNSFGLISRLNNMVGSVGRMVESVGDSVGYKISPQWGRAIGATAGAVIALSIIGGTGGIAAVPLGLGLAAAGIGAVGGGVIGDQAVKRIGAFSLGVGAIATAFYGSTIGGVAFAAATSADQGVRVATGGLGVGGVVGRWTSAAGRRIRNLSTPTEAQQELLNATNARETEARAHHSTLANALQAMEKSKPIDQTQANKIDKNQLSHSKLAEIKTPTKHLQETKSIGYRIRQNILGEPSIPKSNRAPRPKPKKQRQRSL